MKFSLVLCVAALGFQIFQAHCTHHHHSHQHSENPHIAIAQLYTPHESFGSLHSSHHEHYGSHHMKDNVGATIHTTYCGTAYEPNDCGKPECMGLYSGNNVFIQPATGPYGKFAVKCKNILQSLLEFISRPVDFGCAPGSSLNLDLRSCITNHKLPCETICVTEGDVRPVLEEKIVEVSVPTQECATEVYPVVHSHVSSDCGSCSRPSVSTPVKVIPVEVAPVREPVHRVHLEPAVVPTHHYRDVVYEQPIIETEIISPQVCEEEDPKETKHHLHHLQKQLHHMMHNQKKHGHHH